MINILSHFFFFFHLINSIHTLSLCSIFTMKTQHHPPPKLKTQPRPFFSCSFFRHCTQSSLSPTATPPPPPLTVLPPQPLFSKPESSSSSSSSTNSHSFTQWRFPSPIHQHSISPSPSPPIHSDQLQQLFHATELHLATGSQSDKLAALHLLERSLVPNPPSDPLCPPQLMHWLVASLKNKAGAKAATKILLAMCLAEGNRHVAVEAGAVGAVVEVAMELDAPAAERALAALELMCTVPEGAAELRVHALVVPVMVCMMGKLGGRGKEYAISALGVVYSGGGGGSEEQAPPEEVARAVVLALQEDCTERGGRKGRQLLKALEDYGRVDLRHDGNEGS
ncbi:uncharacterized protein [Euphorbia lathyris]|uniref:uncharacterized protein n=1 Tax=Euphorbia lathyris TaxID=212925 RepID=UPI00331414FF